jgi:simple sugar transport system ATP-binding protein
MTNADTTAAKARDPELIIQTVDLTKQFPNVLANDHVSFDVRKGEIHCLLGENGAGKSTLAECLYGSYQADSGQILFKGKQVELSSPDDAIKLGIGMVHQHFVLVRPFTVIENIALVSQSHGIMLDLKSAEVKLDSLCKEYGVDLDLNAEIWQLSVGEQQWVEILKAIYAGVDLLILDEPTAVLTPQETERFFGILEKMRRTGLSIILITHKLNEVIEISDRVTILRKGKVIGTVETSEVTKESLANMMVGREVVLHFDNKVLPVGEPILEISNLRALNDRAQIALEDLSLTLHKNEILGIAGVAGNGQRELFEVLIGVRKAESGQIQFEGEDITNRSPSLIKQRGIAQVPDDRIHEGLVMDFSVSENLILGQQRQKRYRTGPFLDQSSIRSAADKMISLFDIATPSPNHKTKFLSGGNLQKVILARELEQNPKCLLANQPTRGLDIGVIEYVQQQLLKKKDEGVGILLISEDLDEIFALSNRITVIFKGQIMDVIDTSDANLEQVGLLMAGVKDR